MPGHFTLPSGISRIQGALNANGHFICWNQNQVATWSRSNGWQRLPDAPAVPELGHVANGGAVLLADHSSTVGFWKPGSDDWSWWDSISPTNMERSIALTPSHLVVTDMQGPCAYPGPFTIFKIWRISAAGLEPLSEFSIRGWSPVVAATIDKYSNDLILACGDGIYRIGGTFSIDDLRKTNETTIDVPLPARPAITGPNRAVAFPANSGAIVIDFHTGAVSCAYQAHIDGCDALWTAFATDDIELVPLILEALRHVPESLSVPESDLLSLAVYDDLTADVMTVNGAMDFRMSWTCSGCRSEYPSYETKCVKCPGTRPEVPRTEPIPMTVANGKDAEILSWRLLNEREHALQEIVEHLFEFSFINDDALINSFCHAAGNDAGTMIFQSAYGRDPGNWSFANLYRIEKVFGRFGSHNADLIRDALHSQDHATIAVGLAAAAATTSSGEPAVWTDGHTPPIQEICELTHHDKENLAITAIQACGRLKLNEFQNELGRLLDHPKPRIREFSLFALQEHLSLDLRWRERIAELIANDAERSVRVRALETLAGHPRPELHLDDFIVGLGDDFVTARATAAIAIRKMGLRIPDEELSRAFDVIVLLLMAGQFEGNFESEFSHGVKEVPKRLLENLITFVDDRTSEDLGISDECLLDRFESQFLFSIFTLALTEHEYELDHDLLQGMKEMFEDNGRKFPLSDCELQGMLTDDENEPPLTVLVSAMDRRGRTLAQPLAVPALFVRRERAAKTPHGRTPESSEAKYRPLHQRLNASLPGGNRLALCRTLVSIQAYADGTPSLPALFCLAAIGDQDAHRLLYEKILAGDYAEVSVAPAAFIQLLDTEKKRSFLQQLLAAQAIPIRVRYALLQGWESDAGTIDEGVLETFLLLCSRTEQLLQDQRLEAARRLAEGGDLEPLEDLLANIDVAELDADGLYEYSKDMILTGHPEYLDNIRQQWMDRNDRGALHLFASYGDEHDIPILKKALERHQLEYEIHETIYAIQKRLGNLRGNGA